MDEPGVLRVPRRTNAWTDQNDPHSAHKLLASSIWNVFGNQMASACAISQDALVPGIVDILSTFTINFDQMLGVNIHDVSRHFAFFGLSQQMSFTPCAAPVTAQNQPPAAFGIRAVWMQDARESASVGLALHLPQLLLLGSLIGDALDDRIHPAIIDNLARSLVQQIMLKAPPAMTVNKFIDVASFHCFSCQLQPVDLGSSTVKRPQHLLRPQSEQFAVRGDVPLCKGHGLFAPEDCFHNSTLMGWMDLLGVSCITQIPATANACYYLEMDRIYTIYNQSTGCLGTLILTKSGANLEAEPSAGSPCRTGKTFLPLSWHTDLAFDGFIVLPMIRRSGACVRINETDIACLVRDPEADDNFSPDDFKYRALKRFAQIEPIETLYVMKNLLPLGTMVLLKCESQSAAPLLTRIPMPLSRNSLALHGIRGFLNSPSILDPVDGRVYITICVTSDGTHSPEDVSVDPWELCFPGSARITIETVKRREAPLPPA